MWILDTVLENIPTDSLKWKKLLVQSVYACLCSTGDADFTGSRRPKVEYLRALSINLVFILLVLRETFIAFAYEVNLLYFSETAYKLLLIKLMPYFLKSPQIRCYKIYVSL